MKNPYPALPLFLISLPAVAATETAAAEATIEPLGTFYIVCVALAFVALLAGFYWYYMRWDEEEDKPD